MGQNEPPSLRATNGDTSSQVSQVTRCIFPEEDDAVLESGALGFSRFLNLEISPFGFYGRPLGRSFPPSACLITNEGLVQEFSEILHQLRLVVYPIIYKVSKTSQVGKLAGFLNHQR